MTISLETRSITKRVSKLVGQMTLEEKLAQLGSHWAHEFLTDNQFDPQKAGDRLKHGIGQVTRLAGGSTLEPRQAARAANAIQHFLLEQTRLGIPALIHEECCSGAMMFGGTRFPQMLGVASTFEPELAERLATVIRHQLRAIGAHQGLAPVLDISRDPRWGRVEETFGEDPTLVSHFGMAYVRGLQGEDLATGVIATGKHFVGHSLSLGGLNCGPVHMGKETLWNTFLVPFHAAIRDAGLGSIMNAYPELDGELVASSRSILTYLLRDVLGFQGLVVSDYNAIDMIHNYHKVAPDLQTAAKMALEAGIDVELPATYCFGSPLKTALERGEVDMGFVDTALGRHLQAKIDLGLFDNPYVDESAAITIFDSPEPAALAEEIAVKTQVLLKNDGVLPLAKNIRTLAVIGPNANNGRNQLSDYSYASMLDHMKYTQRENPYFADLDVEQLVDQPSRIVTVLDGIKQLVSVDTKILYAKGCATMDADASGIEKAVAIAKQADACVLVLGDRSGLAPGSTTGEFHDSVDIKLPGIQEDLAKAIIALGKPVVVVLVNGRPFAIPWLAEHANAILEAWLPGEQGGAAIASVLFGDENPSGKLPVSMPRHVGQLPVYYNHKPSGQYSNWYGDYVQEKVSPLYPFGHGLSYTTFEYANGRIDRGKADPGELVKVSVDVSNRGTVAGDEVVQLYVRDVYGSNPRPVQELKGYVRVSLQPGETRSVTFKLPVDQLAFFNNDFSLVVESGTIQVMVGSSSQDIRFRADFEIVSDKELSLDERVFECPVEVH